MKVLCLRHGWMLSFVLIAACATQTSVPRSAEEPVWLKPVVTVTVPSGPFTVGSAPHQREIAYRLDEKAYGHSVTRQNAWYSRETTQTEAITTAFEIMRTPVTNAEYARFVEDTNHNPPGVDAATWRSYGLVHDYAATRRFTWTDNRPPTNREQHPVVLVSHYDAESYAQWLRDKTGQRWRLPTAIEWEKAARGADGRYFPWGNEFNAQYLNSHDAGPFDTTPVGQFTQGASPYGALDMAGQVYEWTADVRGDRAQVKGGSWDDKGCGVCRAAASHYRPRDVRHILIGLRLIRDL